MSTLLYVENPIVLSGTAETPVIDGLVKESAGFNDKTKDEQTSTTKLFSYTFPTTDHPRQLWEFKFKINSSKITTNRVNYIQYYTGNMDFYIPQIIIDSNGILGIFILGELIHAKDPATGLPLFIDPATDTMTTTPQYLPDGSIDMINAVVVHSCHKYILPIQTDKYYTVKLILDCTAKYATVIINNVVVGMQSLPTVVFENTFGDLFKDCDFLDIDYFKIIDLDSLTTSPITSTSDIRVVETVINATDIENGVM